MDFVRSDLFDQPTDIPVFLDYTKFKNSIIGIIGATGVLGSIIKNRFVRNGVEVHVFNGDITNEHEIKKWLESANFSHLFHFAAIVPVNTVNSDLARAIEVNTIGTFNICKLLMTNSKCWFFFSSSSHVYKPQIGEDIHSGIKETHTLLPAGTYGKTKLLAEQLVDLTLEPRGNYCVGRIFSFSHKSQDSSFLVPGLIKKIRNLEENASIEVFNAESVRDIIDAESVIDAILWIGSQKQSGIVNIGSGKGMSVAEIALHLAKNMNKLIKIKPILLGEQNGLVADIVKMKSFINGDLKSII
jgi:nucleoside-diphosphate-sugar epimerase